MCFILDSNTPFVLTQILSIPGWGLESNLDLRSDVQFSMKSFYIGS